MPYRILSLQPGAPDPREPGAYAKLKPRHQLIIRLAFEGMQSMDIAREVGLSPGAVRAVLRSQLAKAEIARLFAQADEKLTDIPMRVRLKKELDDATVESVRVNREILTNPTVDPRVRAGVGRHFMDRMIFQHDSDPKEGTYREILREIGELERKLANGAGATVINLPPQNGHVSEPST